MDFSHISSIKFSLLWLVLFGSLSALLISIIDVLSRKRWNKAVLALNLKAIPEKGTTWLRLETVFSPSLKVSGLEASWYSRTGVLFVSFFLRQLFRLLKFVQGYSLLSKNGNKHDLVPFA